jgi:hypothetical protein
MAAPCEVELFGAVNYGGGLVSKRYTSSGAVKKNQTKWPKISTPPPAPTSPAYASSF